MLDDFTTIELAREAYGVVISESLVIDEAATEALRAKLRSERGDDFQGELLTLVSTPHPHGDLALREGHVTDDAAYGVYGRGTVDPGDRPAILVVDYQKAFTTDGLGMGGIAADRARRRQHGAAAAGRARDGRARVPVPRLLRRGRGRARAVGQQGAEARRDHGRHARGSRSTSACCDPSDSLLIAKKWPSVFAGTPLTALLNAQRIDTVIVTGCTTSGCVRATIVDAFSNGFLTLVPEDGVGDQGQGPHDANLLDCERRYAEVTTTDACIDYLQRRAAA